MKTKKPSAIVYGWYKEGEEIITSDDQAVLKKFTRSELIDLLTYVDNDEE